MLRRVSRPLKSHLRAQDEPRNTRRVSRERDRTARDAESLVLRRLRPVSCPLRLGTHSQRRSNQRAASSCSGITPLGLYRGYYFVTPTALGAVGVMQKQPNADPMGRRNSTTGQHDGARSSQRMRNVPVWVKGPLEPEGPQTKSATYVACDVAGVGNLREPGTEAVECACCWQTTVTSLMRQGNEIKPRITAIEK